MNYFKKKKKTDTLKGYRLVKLILNLKKDANSIITINENKAIGKD